MRSVKAYEVLKANNHRFLLTHDVEIMPTLLEQNYINAKAYAHSLRLAAYEYPEAFGRGYKSFSVTGFEMHFLNSGTVTFGIGSDRRLQAGISVVLSPNDTSARIDFLFKHIELKRMDVGRSLGYAAINEALEAGSDLIETSVTSGNFAMRRVYVRYGFKESGASRGSGCKVVKMCLGGRSAIEEVRDKLKSAIIGDENE